MRRGVSVQTQRCCQPQHAYSRYLLLLLGCTIDADIDGMRDGTSTLQETDNINQHWNAEKAARALNLPFILLTQYELQLASDKKVEGIYISPQKPKAILCTPKDRSNDCMQHYEGHDVLLMQVCVL